MSYVELSAELQEVLNDVLYIDSSTTEFPTFTKEVVEKIFWKLVQFNDSSAQELAQELSVFITNLGRAEDQNFVTSVMQRPPARVVEDDIELVRQLACLEEAFFSSLEIEERKVEMDMGRLLFSAARFGGLLNSQNITQLYHKLRNGEPPKVINKTAWYEFKHKLSGNVIWLPDPLTLALITNWLCSNKASLINTGNKRRGWQFYINALGRLGGKQSQAWTRVKLLDACSVRLAMEIAPSLVDMAAGKTHTCAFNNNTWLRLLSEKAPKLSTADKPTQNRSKGVPHRLSGDLTNSYEQELSMRIERICTNKLNKPVRSCVDEINLELEAFEYRVSSNLILLGEWVAFRVLNAGSWSEPLKLSTAKNRFSLLRKLLPVARNKDDLLLKPPEKITELYSAAINSAEKRKSETSKNRSSNEKTEEKVTKERIRIERRKKSIAQALRDFHDFLVRRHGIEPNYEPDKYILISSRANKAISVDAEVLMPWEYMALKEYLKSEVINNTNNEIAKLVHIAIILGYRTGLRRSEVHLLRISDFHISEEDNEATEIIVKEHEDRTLKSVAAYRRIKIGALLTPIELGIVLKHVKERKISDGEHGYLFRISSCTRPFISAKRVFEPVAYLLKQVTGNPSMRFHHLRHSFASWNFWRWMAPTVGNTSGIPTLARLISFERVAVERKAILGLRDGLGPSRKVLHALAMLIGHSEPRTTLRHYIHSSHITLHDQLSLIQPTLKKKELAAISGITPKGLYKILNNQITSPGAIEADEWKASALRERCLRKLKALQSNDLGIKGWRKRSALSFTWANREPSGERMELMDYYLAALDYYEGHDSTTQLESRYAVFGELLSKVIDRAMHILNMEKAVMRNKQLVSIPLHYHFQRIEERDELTGKKRIHTEYYRVPPMLPRQVRELRTLEQMLLSAQGMSKKEKSRLLKALDYFIKNSSNGPNFKIEFKTRRDLNTFVSAMRLFDLKAIDKKGQRVERLRLSIRGPDYESSTFNLRDIEGYWNKTIGFLPYQVSIRNRRLNKSYKNGQATIDLMALKAETSTKPSQKRRVADAGFRVGLYMLYVTRDVWGINN